MTTINLEKIADNLRDELVALIKPKRLKIRTLMKQFNYSRRTEDCATLITEILSERGIIIHPSIMKIGDIWQFKIDDQVSLSLQIKESSKVVVSQDTIPKDWNKDGWFDSLGDKKFRNEKEVESKFIVPLLNRLGYTENDRYDGMTVEMSHGSQKSKLKVDFAYFNVENDSLSNQVLLLAEAKKRFSKPAELETARNQVKSYAMWVSCQFGLITDGNQIEVIDLFSSIGGKRTVFECSQSDLKSNFQNLYKIISKSSLTDYYNRLIK